MSQTRIKTYYLRISKDKFVTVDIAYPSGNWFTEAHLNEIITAFFDKFSSLYSSNELKVFRTPRCTYSIASFPRTFKSTIFQPIEKEEGLIPLKSVSKHFFIRVLGRSDIAEALGDQTTLDSAFRLIQSKTDNSNQ